jgi:2-methylcitrate dehydratase PrpD
MAGMRVPGDLMSIEEQLVTHLREARFEQLPAAAVESAQREILWALGTGIAGSAANGADEVMAFVRQNGGRGESTVWGHGDRVPASLAGFANGVFAKALEYEDKLWLDHAHAYAIGTAVVPAAIAVAERVVSGGGTVSGRDLLMAVALATDIQGRMVRAALGSITTGWNSTYTFSSLGAAMASIRLQGLPHDQAMNAMGLAYAQTTGNYQGHREGVLGVRMMMGFGVRNGITATQLANLGVTGVHKFLTGEFGIYPLFYRDIPYNLDWLSRDLGSFFTGADLGFKAYPCCAVIHSVLDAVLGLGKDMPDAAAVESVMVFGNPRMKICSVPIELRKYPQCDVDCQFSIPWAVACALVDKRVSLSHFTSAALGDARYVALAPRVDIDLQPGRDGVHVEIRLKDGSTLRTAMVTAPKGHFENPLSTAEVVDRYRDCMQYGPERLPRERIEAAKDMVLDLPGLADATAIMRVLTA